MRSLAKVVAGVAVSLASSLFAADRPNVLFLPIDDLNQSLGCYGNTVVQTPNIDKLAQRSVRFTRAYCQHPVCLPSRVSFLSGWYPQRTQIMDFEPGPRDGRMKDVVYLGQHFRNNGYTTARLDKVFHIGKDDRLSWDISEEPIPDKPPMWTGIEVDRLNLKGKVIKEGNHPAAKGEKGPYAILDVEDKDLFDGMKTDRAIELLEGFARDDKPFLLAVGYRRPHLPWIAPKKWFDMYPPEKMPLPPTDPADPNNVPESDHREMIAHYYASTSYMDSQVGRLLEALDRLKLSDNTIIILFGDQGYCLGERGGHFGKGNLWERSCIVPLLVSAPGAARNGQPCERVVELAGLYPMLVDLCGLPQPASGLQGRSLAPLLKGDDPTWRDAAMSWYPIRKGKFSKSVRTERYRYTEDDEGTPKELIDYQADPYERNNLVNQPQMAQTQAQLKAILDENRD